MANFSRLQRFALVLALALAAGAVLPAATITIPATSRGYINSREASSFSDTGEYLVAATIDTQGSVEYRNEFLFLIPTLSGPIQNAALELDSGGIQVPAQSGKTYVVTSAPILFASFSDLGTGTGYGSRLYQNSDSFQPADIVLNAAALLAIQSGEPFLLSGRFANLQPGDFGQSGQIPPGTIAFLGTANRTAQLVLTVADGPQTVPEPGALVLVGAGLGLLATGAGRKA